MNDIVKIDTSRQVSPLMAFAEEGNLGTLGLPIDFKKGQWSVADEAVNNGMRFVVDMQGGYRCVVKWFDKHPVDGTFQLASIANAESLPFRNELGDHDETQWELGLDGKPRDPWVYGHRQIMKGWDDEAKVYTFRTSSFGGKRALQMLYRAYEMEKGEHPGCAPVIELNQEKVLNKIFGLIPEPRFPIIGWRRTDDAPPIEATPDDPRTEIAKDLDDEIPF